MIDAVRELDEVLDALADCDGRGAVLATVVGVSGSTYRREGARLVVPVSGQAVGNVSAGCLEDQIADHAREVVATGRSHLAHFDLTDDDEVWGWGLGCNGTVDVLVEPVERAAPVAAILRTARAEGTTVAVVTVLEETTLGDRVVVHPGGELTGSLGSPVLDHGATELGLAAIAAGRSHTVAFDGAGRAFVEVVEPPNRLVVCGAGADAPPLVELAARLGWSVTVVDDRPTLLTADRFPHARSLVRSEPERAAATVGTDPRTCVVVMSHNLGRDRGYLRSFLPVRCAYLGVVGPSARLAGLLGELRAQGVVPPPEASTRVHGPAGLDLGAEGPHEVALAIVAEILAVRRGAGAGFLRHRQGPIHLRAAEGQASA